jgi:hypothetical protein
LSVTLKKTVGTLFFPGFELMAGSVVQGCQNDRLNDKSLIVLRF